MNPDHICAATPYSELEKPWVAKKVRSAKEDIHLSMQFYAIDLGRRLGFTSYVAVNDQNLKVGGKRLCDLPSTISSLEGLPDFQTRDAIIRGGYIDVIWLDKNRRLFAAVEVEHSTGITTALNRCNGLRLADGGPRSMRTIVIADQGLINKFDREATRNDFKGLNPRFLSYDRLQYLAAFPGRGKIRSIRPTFIDNFTVPPRQRERD